MRASVTLATLSKVTVPDMKKALDNPSLGIKVIDVRSPHEMAAAPISRGKPENNREIRQIREHGDRQFLFFGNGQGHLPLSQINEFDLNQ